MRTLSLDLRQRILDAYDTEEGSRAEIAHRFRVSLGMVKKLLQQRRRTGDIAARHHHSGRKPMIVVTAAKKYGVKAVGFDIDPERIKESKENVLKNGVEKLVTIEDKDIFTVDLSKADVLTLYLLPSLNVKLIPQIEKMKPGSRIVSHSFDMAGIKPDRVIRDGSTIIYKWSTPLKRESKEQTAHTQ